MFLHTSCLSGERRAFLPSPLGSRSPMPSQFISRCCASPATRKARRLVRCPTHRNQPEAALSGRGLERMQHGMVGLMTAERPAAETAGSTQRPCRVRKLLIFSLLETRRECAGPRLDRSFKASCLLALFIMVGTVRVACIYLFLRVLNEDLNADRPAYPLLLGVRTC